MTNIAIDKPIVFYDGACPLCSKEIAHYKNCSGADNVNWLDISKAGSELMQYDLNYNLDYKQAMQRFHVLSPEGQFHIGAYGFVYLWSYLTPYKLLSSFLTRLKLVRPLNWFYLKFAEWRIKDKCDDNCGL